MTLETNEIDTAFEIYFRKPTDHNQCVNTKQNFEIDSAASSGDQEKIMTYASLPWPSLGAALSIFNVSFLVKQFFLKE